MQWHYAIRLSSLYQPQSLRELLQRTWLLSRKIVHFLRINERVLVNGKYVPISTIVQGGDLIELNFESSDFDTPLPPFDPDFTQAPIILYENSDLMVVNKPTGVKTHANQPHELGSMMNFLQAYFKDTENEAYNVHRLDQFTSGALLVAKNPVVVPILNRQISTKVINRTYLCVVSGHLEQSKGTINVPIGFDPDDKRKRQINGLNPLSAITHYQVLAQYENSSLIQVDLETGRTHQIRVHLSYLGHPIIGDPLYNLDNTQQPMLLHSWKIRFPLPFNLETIEVTAPIPDYFNFLTK